MEEAGIPPVQPAQADEVPVVLQVVGLCLDRVRRPANVSQVGQEPVNRDDQHAVVGEHCLRQRPRTGDHHRLHEHRLLLELHDGQGRR